jgi:hypothetical protein
LEEAAVEAADSEAAVVAVSAAAVLREIGDKHG